MEALNPCQEQGIKSSGKREGGREREGEVLYERPPATSFLFFTHLLFCSHGCAAHARTLRRLIFFFWGGDRNREIITRFGERFGHTRPAAMCNAT